MKERFTKKVFSFFLAVLMLATSIPLSALTVSAAADTPIAQWDFTTGANWTDSVNGLTMQEVHDKNYTWSYSNGGVTSTDGYLHTFDFGSRLNNSQGVRLKCNFIINDKKSDETGRGLLALGTGTSGTDFFNIMLINQAGQVWYGGNNVANIGAVESGKNYILEVVLSPSGAFDLVVNGMWYHIADKCMFTATQFNHFAFGVCQNTYYANMTAKSASISITNEEFTSQDKFLFSYFLGEGLGNGEQLRFAVSTDAEAYYAVNDGNCTIGELMGTGHSRDPYIAKGQDGYYYAVATDANCDNGWWDNSNTLSVWRSSDLINWSESLIHVDQITGTYVHRAWAPQFIWDASANKYMVYFALAADGYQNDGTGNNTHMYYMYCDDLMDQSTYSTPVPMFPEGSTRDTIDGDIIEYNGTYYMFFKDENNATICVTKSNKINGPYSTDLVVLQDSSVGALEGCQVFQNAKGEYIFMADRYSNKGVFAMYNLGTDLAGALGTFGRTLNISSRSSIQYTNINECKPRHGAVMTISHDEYAALLNAQFNTYVATSGSGVDLSDDLIARYFVKDMTTDETGRGNNLTNQGGGTEWDDTKSAVYFPGGTVDYFKVPTSNMLDGTSLDDGITISFYGNPADDCHAQGRFFEFTSSEVLDWGTTATTAKYFTMYNNGTVELAAARNGDRFQTIPSAQYSGYRHVYTITLSRNNVRIYVDGAEVTNVSAEYASEEVFNGLKNGYLYLGATGWPDQNYKGYMRDFRVFKRAITADEASKLPAQYAIDNASVTLKAYEAKMKSVSATNIYSNMAPAYEAYVNLHKARDAYYYGGNTAVDIAADADALQRALADMTPWIYTAPNATNSYIKNDDKNESTRYSSYAAAAVNLIYAPFPTETGEVIGGEIHGYLSLPAVVMLYDGIENHTPTAPIMISVGKYKTRKQRLAVAGILSTTDNVQLQLAGKWRGRNAGEGANWDYAWCIAQDEKFSSSLTNLINGATMGNSTTTSQSSTTGYANKLQFTGTLDDNTYSVSTTPTITFYGTGPDSPQNTNDFIINLNSSVNIRIVNYKVVLDALKNNINKLHASDFTNYQEGGLLDVLKAYDTITSKNPMDFAADTVSYESFFRSAVNTLNGVTTGAADSAIYQKLRIEIDNFDENYDNPTFTDASKAEYKNIYEAARTIMADVRTNGYVHEAKCNKDVTALQNVLNSQRNKAGLITALDNKQNQYSLFDEAGEQLYTVADYDTFTESLNNERTTVNDTTYLSKTVSTANYSSIDSDNLTYSKTGSTDPAYNNELTKINALGISNTIVKDTYEPFDAARIVAESMQTNMYTDTAVAQLNELLAQQVAAVYVDVTPESREKYGVPTGVTQLKKVVSAEAYTTALLEAISTIKTTVGNYITFELKLTVKDADGNIVRPESSVSTAKFGDMFEVPSDVKALLADAGNISWEIKLVDKNNKQVGVQQSTSGGTEIIERIANYDTVVTAIIGSENAAQSYQLNIYNAYGNISEVRYFDHVPTLDDIADLSPSVPFFTFDGWNDIYTNADGEYEVKPRFVAGREFNITYTNCTVVKADKRAYTVKANSKTNMVGWAVIKGSGTSAKYQIVAYGTDDYTFVAFANEKYCPIYKSGSNYTVDGTRITKDNLDQYVKPAQTSDINDQEYINNKISTKSPFVYVQAVDKTSTEGKTKYMIRVTKGSDDNLIAYGLTATSSKTGKVAYFNATTKNSAGQVTMTVPNSNVANFAKAGGFVTYAYNYNGYNVNTTDVYYV